MESHAQIVEITMSKTEDQKWLDVLELLHYRVKSLEDRVDKLEVGDDKE